MDAVLSKDLTKYNNPIYADFVRSIAFAIRAQAKLTLNFPLSDVLVDEMNASDLGQLSSMQFVYQKLLDAGTAQSSYAGLKVTPAMIDHYVRAAAALGDGYAARQLAAGKVGSVSDPEEATYWQLCSLVNASVESHKRLEALIREFQAFGSDMINEALEKYSPAGGVIESSDPRLPGRGELTTIMMITVMQTLLERRTTIFDHERAERETPSNARETSREEQQEF